MGALGRGDLEAAHASVNIVPVKPNSRDELGEMAESFNVLQEEVREADRPWRSARKVARCPRRAPRQAPLHRPSRPSRRTALAEQFAQAFVQARENRTSFAVLTVDLDHFKEANDLFGHVIGDGLLCRISRRLQHTADDAFIARMGGDEFTPRLPRLWPSACSMPWQSPSRCAAS
jgi:Diguanylate cyclase, GGDEF domain/HAMP domain